MRTTTSEPMTVGAVLITGASSGIGAAISDKILASGAKVINVSNRPAQHPSAAITYIADLMDTKQTDEVIKTILLEHQIDSFIHCAGLPYMAPIEEFDFDAFDRITHLHLRAAMQCISLLVPSMKKRKKGHIVLIGSRVSLGRVNSSLYGAIKSAIIGLARGLALELASFGININVVSPGAVDTPMFRVYHPEDSEREQALKSTIPMERIATPEDVANAVEFFLKEESSYITGQNLFLCGGLDISSAVRSD